MLSPVTLSGDLVTLEPLSPDHHDALARQRRGSGRVVCERLHRCCRWSAITPPDVQDLLV